MSGRAGAHVALAAGVVPKNCPDHRAVEQDDQPLQRRRGPSGPPRLLGVAALELQRAQDNERWMQLSDRYAAFMELQLQK